MNASTRRGVISRGGWLAVLVAGFGVALGAGRAAADPVVINPLPPGPGIGAGGGSAAGAEGGPENGGLAPNAAVFLCPGVGGAATVVGAGGGYCDFGFEPNGNGHTHCEWGGLSPLISMWQCWRVFKGQPDHPAHPDPDIIPDGWGVPWALLGPSVGDQWPPPGLAPATPPPPPGTDN